MLSFKLRHLCARVLASLSAFGIVSISQRALADSGEFVPLNSEYTWSTPSDLAFTANYEVECTALENATYVKSNEGMCTYTCNDGYTVHKANGDPLAFEGQTGKYQISFTAPAGSSVSNLSGCKQLDLSYVSCSVPEPDSETGGGYKTLPYAATRVVGGQYAVRGCAWECNRGYATTEGLSGVTGAELTSQAIGFEALDTGKTSGYCYPIWYTVTYDCVGGEIVGTGTVTKTEQRAYSDKFLIETACEDTSGFFKGWTVTLK